MPPCLPELFGERRIASEAVHLGREIGLEGGDELRIGCPGRIVRNEQARCAVDDHLRDSTHRGGDDRGLAGHGLQVHDAQGLVDTRAGENRRMGHDLPNGGPGQHFRHPDHRCAALGLEFRERPVELGGDLRGVGGAREQHHLGFGIELLGCPDQVDQPLLAGYAAHENHRRAVQVDAQALHHVGAVVRFELVGVDSVLDHEHPVGIQVRVGGENVLAHPRGDGDDGVGGLEGGLLRPG